MTQTRTNFGSLIASGSVVALLMWLDQKEQDVKQSFGGLVVALCFGFIVFGSILALQQASKTTKTVQETYFVGETTERVACKKGDFIVIELPCRPSTGYTWELPLGLNTLEVTNEWHREKEPAPEDMVGQEVIQGFQLYVRARGTTTFEMRLVRPWNGEVWKTKAVSVDVR